MLGTSEGRDDSTDTIEKPNWVERQLLKLQLKKTKKTLKKLKKDKEKLEDEKRRDWMIKEILNMGDNAFTIEERNPDTGKMEVVSKELLETMNTIELLELLDECVEQLKKMV